jgi:Spy/CpxP family protein refolding chaperone
MFEIGYMILLARRTLPLLAMLLALCGSVGAQPDGPGGPPPDGPPPGAFQPQQHGPSVDRELKQLTQLLALTAGQQSQVKDILTEQHARIEALFKPASSTAADAKNDAPPQPPDPDRMEAIRAAAKSIREAAQERIKALLSADQAVKFAAYAKKRARSQAQQESEDMPPPPPDGEGGPPPDGGGDPGGGAGGGTGGGPPGI